MQRKAWLIPALLLICFDGALWAPLSFGQSNSSNPQKQLPESTDEEGDEELDAPAHKGPVHPAWDRWHETPAPFLLRDGRDLVPDHHLRTFLKNNPDPEVKSAFSKSETWDNILTLSALGVGSASVVAITGYIKDKNGNQNLSNATINKFWLATATMGVLAIVSARNQNQYLKKAHALHNASYSLFIQPNESGMAMAAQVQWSLGQ